MSNAIIILVDADALVGKICGYWTIPHQEGVDTALDK